MELHVLMDEDWQQWRRLRLAALAEAPQAFSAKLSEWQGAADTPERWRNRLRAVPLNLIAKVDGEAAGMVSATSVEADGDTELISLWVAPFARGRGVGDLLVAAVVSWAKAQGARRIRVGVAQTNEHAARLYDRHGFMDVGYLQEIANSNLIERRMERNLRVQESDLMGPVN